MRRNKYKSERSFLNSNGERAMKKNKINIFMKEKSLIILILIIIAIIQFIINLFFFLRKKESEIYNIMKEKNTTDNLNIVINDDEKIEDIDTNILLSISSRLGNAIEITLDEQKYFNGMIRKFKPKKIVEIGVSGGGTSSLILNAIKDIPEAKLYSIERRQTWYKDIKKKSGWLVEDKFPELKDKWTLYAGVNTAEVIEKIGNNIDFVFIDTVHLCPGEMLNLLEILPFLKEEAIVVIHDTYLMFIMERISEKQTVNYSNNQLLCYIRGELILPSYGNEVFSRNIGGMKLLKNQKNYYKQYFLALGTQWEYLPEENDLKILREFYLKYYGEKLVEIYDDAVSKNKKRFTYKKSIYNKIVYK